MFSVDARVLESIPQSTEAEESNGLRPTDLIARGSSRVAGAGINFQTELRRRTFEVTAASARGIADRARHLPPLSAFGHGNPRHGAERGAIGTHSSLAMTSHGHFTDT